MKKITVLLLAFAMIATLVFAVSCKRGSSDQFEEFPTVTDSGDVTTEDDTGFVTAAPVDTEASERLDQAPPNDEYGWGPIQ